MKKNRQIREKVGQNSNLSCREKTREYKNKRINFAQKKVKQE